MHVKPTKRVFRDDVQCSGAHPQATSCGGVEADRWVGEGLTLETLHGLPEARPLSPVTPVDVKLWSDPVTAYELLNALQPVRTQRHPRGADFHDLRQPGDDIAVRKRLRNVSCTPKHISTNDHLPGRPLSSRAPQFATPV